LKNDTRESLRSTLESWLTLALAAAGFATLLFHYADGLDQLVAGAKVGLFWWAAIGICYLAVALAAGLLAWIVARIIPWRRLPLVLRTVAAIAFFGNGIWSNRRLVSARPELLHDSSVRIALAAALLLALIAALTGSRWRWPRRATLVLAVVALVMALHGQPAAAAVPPPSPTTAQPTGERLLLIGIDGADPRFVDRLIAEGKLPHIAALRDSGVSGRLATLIPTSSPLIWTTMVTGRPPQVHGVQGHAFERPRWIFERVPEKADSLSGFGIAELREWMRDHDILVLSPATSQERRVPAYWNLATLYRQPVSVVGWWATWPAESILGRISSDRLNYYRWEARGATDLDRHRITFPPELVNSLRRLIVPPEDVTYDQAKQFLDVTPEQWQKEFDRAYQHHEVRSEFRYYYSQFVTDAAVAKYFVRSDLAANQVPMDLMVLFRLVDQTSHCCLQFSDLVDDHLRSSDDEIARYHRVVESAYEAVDREVGELVELFGAGNVILVSDHGFQRTGGRGGGAHYAHPRAPAGIFVASGPAFRQGTATKLNVSEILPILLYLKGMPISDQIEAPTRTDLFTDVFQAAHPQLHVPTYGTLRHTGAIETESSADEALMKELKALGYIQ